MSHYHHLSIEEREKILVLHAEKKSLQTIAREIGRNASTISRELRRNKSRNHRYSANKAQERYKERRKKSRRRKLLDNEELKKKVQRLFLEEQWSPEQIANRLEYEGSPYRISYNTIYRAIYMGEFDTEAQKRSRSDRGAVKKLRHKGKTRHRKGTAETRGKIVISNVIQERPVEADERSVIGHWEADTLIGKREKSCLVTVTDRNSRYLLAGKIPLKRSELLANKMIDLFSPLPVNCMKSITPDRGKEFAKHADITSRLRGVQFYFPDPHAPWQRGTNENTNGLLREYFPKSFDFDSCPDDDIAFIIDKINKRPRKCLGWISPFELFFNKSLHFT